MSFKAIHQNLVMGEAVPYGQRWTYYTMHPMDAVLQPGYFLPQRNMLKVGDFVDIIRRDGNGRPVELLETLVAQSSEQGVTLFVKHRHEVPAEIKPPQAPPRPLSQGEYSVKKTFGGGYNVVMASGKVVSEHSTKKEAEEARDEIMGKVAA